MAHSWLKSVSHWRFLLRAKELQTLVKEKLPPTEQLKLCRILFACLSSAEMWISLTEKTLPA